MKCNLDNPRIDTFQQASMEDILAAETKLGMALPAEYTSLLLASNGLTRTCDGLVLYDVQALEERNKTYEVKQYLPGFLLIGDNSGGYGVLLALAEPYAVVMSGFGDFSREGLTLLADSMRYWLNHGMPLPD